MTLRTDRIAALLEQAIGQVLARGLADPRVKGLITITGVRVSDDLARAVVSISITPEAKVRVTLAGLIAAGRHIRHEASNLIDLRRMPQFQFVLDEGIKRQSAVFEALARVEAERAERASGELTSVDEPKPADEPVSSPTDQTREGEPS